MGKYVDDVLYDVMPMQAGHILLGRPWKFDRRVHHDGFTNKYSFVMDDKNIILSPLSPKEVYEDQMIMRERENMHMREKKKRMCNKRRDVIKQMSSVSKEWKKES